MTLSLLENVKVLKTRKRQLPGVEELSKSGVKKGKSKVASGDSQSEESRDRESSQRDGAMAAACAGDFSPSSKLLGMGSNLTEFGRPASLIGSRSVDAKAGEVVAEDEKKCDLIATALEDKCALVTVPSIPDSGAGDSFLQSSQWDTASVSCLPLPSSFGSNRDRLHHHRLQVAGHVTIPDSWPGEQHLLDWTETEPVEEALRPLGLMIARAALIEEHLQLGGRRKV